ncbi:MAG: DUF3990 domain-containing protein [Clostridiales Family XIII bacterium]|jgi:hypothetical protein|nr:DUF3990 domain-containing protein [Clostridiales Family XIII bacterium]
MNVITLYHGTIYDFDVIEPNRGKPFKDFGRGFYVSRTESQAERIAIRNRNFENDLLIEAGGEPTAQAWFCTYEFDADNLNQMNVKEFTEPSEEWVRFVVKNRSERNRQHNYDIVMGPTANDDTNVVVQAFLNRIYGDPNSELAIRTFLQYILPGRLPYQMFFGTSRAVSLLRFVKRRAIR